MAEISFTDEDISSLYRQMIELGGVNTVDDSPDKYVRCKLNDKIAFITSADGKNKDVAIYGSKNPNVIILNPLAEGDTESAANSWFMSTCNTVLAGNLARIIKAVLDAGVESHKKKKGKEEENNNLVILKLLGKDAEAVDEKMLKEFDNIARPATKFFTIHYNRATKQGEVKCPIFTLAQRKSNPNVRVKTWETLQHILGRILGTEKLEEFSYSPGTIGIPAFESFANILVRIYDAIQEPLSAIGVKVEHLGELKSHLKYLPQYYAKAKWCVTPQCGTTQVQTTPVTTSVTPWVAPTPSPAQATPVQVQPAFTPAPSPMVQVPVQVPTITATTPVAVPPVFGGVPVTAPQQPAYGGGGANSNNPFARA